MTLFSVYALCQVVELHLEKLWGYEVEEETSDPSPGPTMSHRYHTPHMILFIKRQ